MKTEIFNLLYDLLVIVGVIVGLYGIFYESTLLKWIGAILVFGMPATTFLVKYGLHEY